MQTRSLQWCQVGYFEWKEFFFFFLVKRCRIFSRENLTPNVCTFQYNSTGLVFLLYFLNNLFIRFMKLQIQNHDSPVFQYYFSSKRWDERILDLCIIVSLYISLAKSCWTTILWKWVGQKIWNKSFFSIFCSLCRWSLGVCVCRFYFLKVNKEGLQDVSVEIFKENNQRQQESLTECHPEGEYAIENIFRFSQLRLNGNKK